MSFSEAPDFPTTPCNHGNAAAICISRGRTIPLEICRQWLVEYDVHITPHGVLGVRMLWAKYNLPKAQTYRARVPPKSKPDWRLLARDPSPS